MGLRLNSTETGIHGTTCGRKPVTDAQHGKPGECLFQMQICYFPFGTHTSNILNLSHLRDQKQLLEGNVH